MLGPWQVFLILMRMSVLGTKGFRRTMIEMKQELGRSLGWEKGPTASAFSQARRKLDAGRCAQVFSQVHKLCKTARELAKAGYFGLRVVAIDGTKLMLPAYEELRRHFGCPTQSPKGPQASLTMLWDVGANQPIDWRLGPTRVHERGQGLDLARHLGPNDLLIADRGFSSRRMLLDLILRGAQFLMRIRCDRASCLKEVADFADSGRKDAVVSLLTRTYNDAPAITVRLIRHVLSDGTVTVFVTSLWDQRKHPADTLIELYAQRWEIETAFRELKLWHGLERFNAHHVDGIAQEVCAVMVFQLLASELQARAERHHGVESPARPQPRAADPPIRFNRILVADWVVALIKAGAVSDKEVRKTFDEAMDDLWRYRQKPRPGRSFPRERKSSTRGWKSSGTKGKGRA